MDIDKKLVQNTELTFLKENLTKTLLLNDDGIVELYEEGKLIDSKPFSKINVERDYKKIIQEGYALVEDKDELIKFNVYLLCGENGVYNSKLVDTVDSLEQAQDRVAELEAENGCGAYYEKVDENGKVLEEDNNLSTDYKQAMKELDNHIKNALCTYLDSKTIEQKILSHIYLDDDNYNIIHAEDMNEQGEDGIYCRMLRKALNTQPYKITNKNVINDNITLYTIEKKLEEDNQNLQQDLDKTEQELQDDIEQVDRAQELKDELEDKLDKLYNENKELKEEKETIKDKFDLETCIKNHINEMYHTSILKDVKSSFIDWSDRKYYHLEFFITEPDYQYNPLKTNTIKKWILDTFDIDKNNLEVSMYKQGHYSGGNRVYNINYYLPDKEIKTETTNKQLEKLEDELREKQRQALKDAGDPNWQNLVGIAKRLPAEVWKPLELEEDKLSCISMIHSILTYTEPKLWTEQYVLEDKYIQKYFNMLGEDLVKELVKQEVEEYKNNAIIDKDVYTDSEGVSYNSVNFKNENKITESPEKIPGAEIKNIKEITPEIPTSEDITKKLSKQEILNLTTLNLNEEQENFLKHLEITEQEIIDAFKDLVQQMKHLQYDKPFMSIKEYIDEVLKF